MAAVYEDVFDIAAPRIVNLPVKLNLKDGIETRPHADRAVKGPRIGSEVAPPVGGG